MNRALGAGATDAVAVALARDAMRLFGALLRELPNDGAHVRGLVARHARHAVLAAYFDNRATELGLDNPLGEAADDRATKHGQRAERLAVTALDVSTKLAAARANAPADLSWLNDPGEPESEPPKESP